jgi:hypothetical protein
MESRVAFRQGFGDCSMGRLYPSLRYSVRQSLDKILVEATEPDLALPLHRLTATAITMLRAIRLARKRSGKKRARLDLI